MWPIVLALLGFAWARFQWITFLQARLFVVLTGSVSYHRILAAASRQIFSSGSFQTYISLVAATWTLSTLVLGVISLAWVLAMVLYRSYYRWLTRVSKRPLDPRATASEAVVTASQAIAEPPPASLCSESIVATQEFPNLSEPERNAIDGAFVHHDTLVPFENLLVDTRHSSLPDYDSLDSISSVNSISGNTLSNATLQERGYEDSDNSAMEDLFSTRFSGGAMTNQTRAKANLLISKITSIKRRLIERVTLEIASTHADFSVGPATRNEICKDLRNKLCRSEIHLSRVIGFIIQEAMGYSEYSLDHADSEPFLSMSVDDMENYCASIITGSAAWEVPPAPPSTRAATPTPDDGPQSSTAEDSSVLCAMAHPSKADFFASDFSSPCRNTLIFSASEEENLQDLLTDLKHLPPGSPVSISRRPPSKGTGSGYSDQALASWHRTMSKVSSGTHPSGGQTGADAKGKLYEPLSPISPFIGGKDAANQSFSTSTPRGPKSFNAANGDMDMSMNIDASAILDTTMIMDTSMILDDDSSLDTIRLGAGANVGVGTGVSAGASSSAGANIARRWSAKINLKDRKRAVQEPNTPPHTPLAVVNGILRARAVHAERRKQHREESKRKEQADTAAVSEHSAHARRRGHVRSGSSTAGRV